MKNKKIILVLISLIIACCFIPVCLSAAGSVLVIADPIDKADAAVILSGGEMERLTTASILYHNQTVEKVIITETGNTVEALDASYTKLYKEHLRNHDVPDDAVLITTGISSSTYDEANAVKDLLYKVDLGTVIVVTDPYHTFRTRLIFREVFANSNKSASVIPSDDHWYKSTTWFLSIRGWKTTMLEYIKVVGYFFGYKTD
ncbi:MAG: YdcF family protein [Anaerolineaceae bacterium]|nr:YdcF family protein [Anaerolineaceae bacterium]